MIFIIMIIIFVIIIVIIIAIITSLCYAPSVFTCIVEDAIQMTVYVYVYVCYSESYVCSSCCNTRRISTPVSCLSCSFIQQLISSVH